MQTRSSEYGVEDEDLRLAEQCGGQAEPLPHA
jgi:hypothetical protein